MGGSISYLRQEIQYNARIAQQYKHFLEPVLTAIQYFLEVAEEGEGINREDEMEEDFEKIDQNVANSDYVSTEVELIAENLGAIDVLLEAIISYDSLELAPEKDPVERTFLFIKRKPKDMPVFAVIQRDDLPRYRVSVLRLALRCLRIICVCDEVRKRIYTTNSTHWLNQAVEDHPFDNFIRSDVKRIFTIIYGGNKAINRILIASMQHVVDIMKEYQQNAFIQTAGIRRVYELLSTSEDKDKSDRDIHKFNLLPTVGIVLKTFTAQKEGALFTVACRLFALIGDVEKNCKIIGQQHGVEGAINLLKYSRGFYFSCESSSVKSPDEVKSTEQPPGENDDTEAIDQVKVEIVESLGKLTMVDMAQQALWTLDVLSSCDYNVTIMKRMKLKYILQEIALDPKTRQAGSKLIIPRRLKQIKWEKFGNVED